MEKCAEYGPPIVKFLIILCCSVYLFIQGQKCVQRYSYKDSRMIVTQKASQDATFVAFTVCPQFEMAYKDDVLESIGLSKHEYRNGKHMDIDFFDKVSYNLTEVLDSLTITTVHQKITIDVEKLHGVQFHTKYYRKYGKCFSLDISQEVINLGITRIEFVTKMDAFVYLHHPGQFMNIDQMAKVYTQTHEDHFIDISFAVVVNTLEEERSLSCSHETSFGFDDCLYKGLYKALTKKFNCTVPFLPKRSKSKTCENKEKIAEIMQFFKNHSSHGQRELCAMPCSTINIDMGLLYGGKRTPEDGKAYIKFYLKTFTNIKRIVYDYTLVSMVAEIGGYTGLLLGVSVADLTMLVEQFRKYLAR